MYTNNCKRVKYRFAASILALMLFFAAFPLNALATISGSEFDSKLSTLRNTYPNYSTWTGTYAGGSQCWGFARLIADKVFGGNSSSWPQVNNISGVKKGDIVQYGNTSGSGHTIFVTNVSENTITFVDCNGNGNYSGGTKVRSCGIKWDNTISKGAAMFGKYSFSYLLSSPGVGNVTPRGEVQLVEGVDGKLHIKGWAIDDNTPNQPVNMHVYFGGKAAPDVHCEEGGSTNPTTHEFDTYISTDYTGQQRIYIYFLDVEGFTEMGPYDVYIPLPDAYLFNPAVYDDAWYAKYNDAVRNMTEEQRRQHWVKYGSSVGEQASSAFFAIEYKQIHQDVANVYQTNDYQFIIKHFNQYGINEMRKGRYWFDPQIYIDNYKDIKDFYGNDKNGYYTHFVQFGHEEGRIADRRLKIYFDTSNGGTSSEAERDLMYGGNNDGTVIGTLPTLTRQGYTGAWYTKKTGGTKVTPNFSLEHEFMVSNNYGDLRLYAQWTPKKVTGISIPGTQTVTIGESKTLSVTVTPADALNRNLTWKSSNTSVVTVTNGTIKGIREGTATVTATAGDGSNVSASCTVTVKPTITGLTLNRSSLQLAGSGIGSTYILKVTKTPGSGQGTVNWSTSNSSVAQVTQSGAVTAKGTGTATITANVVNGPSVSCTVSVGNMTLMTLPAGVKTIEDQAFLRTAASRIVIPTGVESIGAGAFANSSALRFVSVPDSVVTIEDSAFAGDPNLCIICSENSAAKTYAVSHGIEYTTVSNN